ncbi:Pirin-related protein [Corynebacterium kutscheri]|uniref:Pirin C-terminal domain-containing protein n=1 Tax=Corynebacterium kutscheri TaxID=35755 RepID=A0A0F6TCU0_9CORY|nr:pirin family protein [Corynebacterium kutscheri]AKE40564.1 Pirin-related protein [Corynebacterium kutscheri]VEH04952.1 Pirin C-terminal domain-containing protein [Corynebacterium kutscheri]VEH10959.1 Pirin C-terminal domain-containing protein [Corynebacterium kutscheri]
MTKNVPVEIITARIVPLGGPRAMSVWRTLPQKQRGTIGAWCFVDHYGPDHQRMDVPPHPHTGLQTVSWLFDGEITHHDSGGNHAVVVPGELVMMTAGHGICHSEVSTQSTDILHGVQFWLVQPEATRNGERRLDTYRPTPIERDGVRLTVFLGRLAGEASPVVTDTPIVGAEIVLPPGKKLHMAVDASFEHGVLVDTGEIELCGSAVKQYELGYTGVGEEELVLHNTGAEQARLILIGGQPFQEEFVMYWNYIARNHAEIEQAHRQWSEHSQRFGVVHGYISHDPHGITRLPGPAVPSVTIRPRKSAPPVARPDIRTPS